MDKSFVRCRTDRFATKVTHNPAIRCSDDTQVAVCTEDGIYVLMIQCDQIYPSDKIVLHTSKIAPHGKVKIFDVDVPRLKVERSLSKIDGHQLMLDRTISPLIQSNQVLTGFKVVAWSPQGADTLGRCVIASLSCDHRLCIHELQQNGQAWNKVKVVELSSLFYEYVKGDHFHLVEDRIAQENMEHGSLMEKLKWRTYCLAAIEMTWSPVFMESSSQEMMDQKKESQAAECSKFAMLAVAMKSGHVVLWKVTFPITSECCHIEQVLNTGSDVPTGLCWAKLDRHTAVLAVATLNGQLKQFLITTSQTSKQGKEEAIDQDSPEIKKRRKVNVEKSSQESCVKDLEENIGEHSEDLGDVDHEVGPHHKQTNSPFRVTEVDPLWSECDRSAIRNLCWSSQDNLLFASKGPFLLTFHIAVDVDSTRAPVDCPKVKVKAHPSKLIGDKLGISALWVNRSKLFVSLISGPVCCVNIGQDSSLKVEGVDIQRDVDTMSWKCHGVCGSPGGVYLYLGESPSGNYCHLTVLQPLKLTVVLRADTDIASVLLRQEESLSGCVDALTQVKFILAQKEPLPESLAQLVKEKSAWPKLPIGRQKLVRFLLQVMKLSDTESEMTSEDVLEVEKLIMKSHLETALTRLLKTEVKPTTDAEKKSMMLACDWLGSCHGYSKSRALHLTQKVITQLEKVHAATDTKDKCEICQADVAFTSFRQEKCPNGHLFARCCQTLLLCHGVPYRTCTSCEVLAVGQHISGSSWFEDLKTNRCTFCDGLLL